MRNQTHVDEREALDQGLLDGGSLAARMLSAAAASGLRRDAAQANVVLAFEVDVSHHLRTALPGPDVDIHLIRRRERTRGLVERMVELALRVADIARLASRPGAPAIDEFDRLCRLSEIAAVSGRALLTAPEAAFDSLAEVLDELLRRAEGAAQRSARTLEIGSPARCLAS
jgi:hypothetical protein